jgi:predicted AlkP superfamily phosphohydrolase/phosphomutase
MVALFRRKRPRVMVIGLDCAEPSLVFGAWAAHLPHLTHLRERGLWGELESTTPCITVPAWSSMLSSRDPGVLGFYGFRNRAAYDYGKLSIATSLAVKEKRVWDYLSEVGKTSVVVGVPQTYPVKPLKGFLTSCFLTPNLESPFAYPPEFRDEVLTVSEGRYQFDVKDFRTDDKDKLLQQLIDMTEVRFRLLKHLLMTKDWDFFMWVEMGVDRIHHGFWRYHDPAHRLYTAGNRYENAILDYYKQVDAGIGALLQHVDEDTALLVVSDHGAKRMDGGVCLNDWLWRNGWLALKNPPAEGQILSLDKAEVDWSGTRAWGDGGYYGRLFLNVQGREPQGLVPPEAYEETLRELESALNTLRDADTGQVVGATCYRPSQIYQAANNFPPDFIIYFGDLHYRSIGGVGYGRDTIQDNDTGPDDANHAQQGLFIWVDPAQDQNGRIEGRQLMDVAPTLLKAFGLDIPPAMQGQPFA